MRSTSHPCPRHLALISLVSLLTVIPETHAQTGIVPLDRAPDLIARLEVGSSPEFVMGVLGPAEYVRRFPEGLTVWRYVYGPRYLMIAFRDGKLVEVTTAARGGSVTSTTGNAWQRLYPGPGQMLQARIGMSKRQALDALAESGLELDCSIDRREPGVEICTIPLDAAAWKAIDPASEAEQAVLIVVFHDQRFCVVSQLLGFGSEDAAIRTEAQAREALERAFGAPAGNPEFWRRNRGSRRIPLTSTAAVSRWEDQNVSGGIVRGQLGSPEGPRPALLVSQAAVD